MTDAQAQKPFDLLAVNGRASRTEFALVLIAWGAAVLLRPALAAIHLWAALAVGAALSVALILSGVRRLHDRGQSGWWMLLGFVPLVNVVFFVWLAALAGDRDDNRFGAPAQFPRQAPG